MILYARNTMLKKFKPRLFIATSDVKHLAELLALSQLRICRSPLTFDQPFMDDGESVI